MNSVYFQVQGVACLHQNIISIGKLKAMWNLRKNRNGFYDNASETDFLTTPLSSAISDRSLITGTPKAIREWLMLSQEDSHANRSVLPEKRKEQTIPEICGLPLAELSTSSDHPTPFWKTCQVLLVVDISETFLKTFPKSGMMRNGKLYQRKKQVPNIKEIDYGLWPTPRVFMYKDSKIDRGRSNLGEVVFGRTFPTPTTCGNYNRKGASKTSGDGLATVVKNYPTPTAADHRDRGGPSDKCIQRREKKGKSIELSMKFDGSLNPDWVEWLMA